MPSIVHDAFNPDDNHRYIKDPLVTNTVVTLAAGTYRLLSIRVKNKKNKLPVYLKIWCSESVTLGTTAEDYIFKIEGGETTELLGAGDKPYISTALSYACVSDPGTNGIGKPKRPVGLYITAEFTDIPSGIILLETGDNLLLETGDNALLG